MVDNLADFFVISDRLGGFCKFHQLSGRFLWDGSFGTGLVRFFFGGGLNPKPSSLRFCFRLFRFFFAFFVRIFLSSAQFLIAAFCVNKNLTGKISAHLIKVMG